MLKIALAGNPNCGKTTLFNALTGSTAHVGNWPGVTVDKKEGTYKKGKVEAEIIDLPGIYSLSPYTPEEVIARNYILDGKPSCIVNIVDATNLERNLYLTTQIMEVDVPVVVALNMTDVLEKNGDSLDAAKLEQNLGVPVVKISALKEKGLEELMERALAEASKKRKGSSVLSQMPIGKVIANAESALKLKDVASPLFHAVKLVEKDELEVKAHPREAEAVEEFVKINYSADSDFGTDTEAAIADARYKYISANFSSALKRAKKKTKDGLTKSDKADRVLTNRWAAIPIFLVILFAVFHLTFSEDLLYLGTIIKPFGEWCGEEADGFGGAVKTIFFAGGLNSPGMILFNLMDVITSSLGELFSMGLDGMGAHAAVSAFLVDGVWGGIAAVLSFVPQILVLFLFFSILEDSGYMARVAFILDRIFRRFGVSGRAFMPMIMGFGCSVPAMLNTRTLANDKERTATIRVIPFFSCGAKLPILTAIAGAIVATTGVAGGMADVITYSMYLIGIIIAILSLLIMRSTTMRGETPPFIMELPTYHFPGFKNLMLHLWDKLKHYVKKAFTIILVSTVVIWFLSNFAWNWRFLMEDCIQLVKTTEGFYLPAEFFELTENGWQVIGEFAHYYDAVTMGTVIDGSLTAMHYAEYMQTYATQADYTAFASLLQTASVEFANVTANESILGSIGMLITPIFTPLGFGSQLGQYGWIFVVGAITGLIAKENVIATFGTLAACLGAGLIASEDGIAEVQVMMAATGITVPALIAFITFNMTTIPCFAAVASAKGEVQEGTFKWTLLFWVVASYLASCAVYCFGTLFDTAAAWSIVTSVIWVAVAAIAVVGIVLYNKRMKAKEGKMLLNK